MSDGRLYLDCSENDKLDKIHCVGLLYICNIWQQWTVYKRNLIEVRKKEYHSEIWIVCRCVMFDLTA